MAFVKDFIGFNTSISMITRHDMILGGVILWSSGREKIVCFAVVPCNQSEHTSFEMFMIDQLVNQGSFQSFEGLKVYCPQAPKKG